MDKEVSVFFRDLAKVAVADSMPQNTPEHERQVPVDYHPSNFVQERLKYSQWTYKMERHK